MNQKGFSIIDFSIILVVLGLAVASALQGYKVWNVERVRSTTKANMANVMRALSDYYFLHDHYPCPADITKSAADGDYGEEDCNGTPIMTGGVPFKALKLPELFTLDGWSRKLIYVVGSVHTDAATFDTSAPIVIREFNNMGVEGVPDSAQLLLFSTGDEGIGGYTRNGSLASACQTGTREGENCNGDETFIHPGFMRNLLSGADYYDDLMITLGKPPGRMWDSSPTDSNDIFTTVNTIGIGNKNPVYNIDVDGNILTNKAHGGKICDINGNNCFAPGKIGGSGIHCHSALGGNETAMTGIAHADAVCNTSYNLVGTGSCGNGELMTGIDGSGNIICAPVN